MSRPSSGSGGDPGDVLHLVVPHTIDDPQHPSGGNLYDLELARGLRSLGQQVCEHRVWGSWPPLADSSATDLARVLAGLPDGATVLIDGLVGLGAVHVLVSEHSRIRLWLLLHLPLVLAVGDTPQARAQELQALSSAAGVITTSDWTRRWLRASYGLKPEQVSVARPGVHRSRLSTGSPHEDALVSVGAVVPDKGYDVLVDALTNIADLSWSCDIVGSLDRAPAFVDRLRRHVRTRGLEGRIRFTGPLTHAGVSAAYDSSDLLVLPSRLETYGMVLTEALAHGLPVVASRTGGVPEAVGSAPDGTLPGVLVPPGDAEALSTAARRWLQDPAWRRQLRATAHLRRAELPDWTTTADNVQVALQDAPHPTRGRARGLRVDGDTQTDTRTGRGRGHGAP